MIQVRHKNGDRGFILLPPLHAVLPRSDAGSDGVEPAHCVRRTTYAGDCFAAL